MSNGWRTTKVRSHDQENACDSGTCRDHGISDGSGSARQRLATMARTQPGRPLHETGLLEAWPKEGPKLVWQVKDLDLATRGRAGHALPCPYLVTAMTLSPETQRAERLTIVRGMLETIGDDPCHAWR